MKSPPLENWFGELHRNVVQAWDNPILCTGEEGTWKSLWMRKAAKTFDPKFTVDRIHFKQEDFLEDVASLEPGRAVVLDEFKGHKRQAMYGFRMEFLQWAKDNREQGITAFIGFPHVTQFETDLLKTRMRYWVHKPSRPQFVIRSRVSKLMFDKFGQPVVNTKFPIFGNYGMTGDNDPLRALYQVKKKAHMRAVALERTTGDIQFRVDDDAFEAASALVKPLKGRRAA